MSTLLCACAVGPGAAPGTTAEARPEPIQRTLVAGVRTEPTSVAVRSVGPSQFAGNSMVTRLFNATLTVVDDHGALRPYLTETLPQLHTDSWRISPEGGMEVLWKLRPGIVWQDGTPLSTEDFLFSWQVYSRPELGSAGAPLLRAIQAVEPVDGRTVLVRYRQPFPDALTDTLEPLPRHLLEDALQQNDANTFANSPYWTSGYVGLGPWTLNRWEPGAFIEGMAFDGHVLGRPKIDRVRAVFVGDANTAMAKLLAGEVHVVASGTFITIEQARQLKERWDADGGGTVALFGNLLRVVGIQLRPEYATPPALLDPNVRKALASAVDKEALGDALYGPGVMRPADFFVPPDTVWGPDFMPSVVRYSFDPRRAEQFMQAAGFARGDDAFFVGPGGRFKTKLETAIERADEMTIMNNGWRGNGFDVEDAVLAPQLASDPAARVLFSGMSSYTSSWTLQLGSYSSSQCPRAETNYRVGNNRGCWTNPEFDRLYAAFSTTLDPAERGAQLAGMAALFGEELPTIPLHFVTQPYVWVSSLRGVQGQTSDGDLRWNMHEWEWIR